MVSSRSETRSGRRDQGDDVLLAFREWLTAPEQITRLGLHPGGYGSSDDDDDTAREEFHSSPGISAAEPLIEPKSRQPSFRSDGISRRRRSVGRRAFRTVARGFIFIAVMVGAAYAWQSYADDNTRNTLGADIVRTLEVSQGWFLSVLRTELRSNSDVPTKPVSQTSGPAPTVTQSAPAEVVASSSLEFQNQLDDIKDTLTVVRSIVEQLAARQEQLTQDIATLQAAEQKISQNIAKPPPPTAVHVPPAKNVPRILHPVSTPLVETR